MPDPFYRGTDAELASGATNAVAIITPVPATYGVTAAFVTSYTTLTTNFNNLLALAVAPATRTPVAIENKNVARKLLRDASVNLARIATATPTVTNAQLLSLRMNERIVRQPRPVPQDPPAIDVKSVSGRVATIRVHDSTVARRGRPFGAIGANIFSAVGPTPPTDQDGYDYQGMTSRTVAQVQFPDSVASGATVWLSARWVNARGEMSPGSVPISFTLQGGAIPASA